MNTVAYNPMEYWNTREHPNTAINPPVSPNEEKFLLPLLNEANSVLEIGPGIGRLFPLYKSVPRVATVDLSLKYKDRAEKTASALAIGIESYYIESALTPLPFEKGEFDIGIAAFVFIHVPFENIAHSLSEAARCCKNVVILSAVDQTWPTRGMKFDPKWHCFNHDYELLCGELGLRYYGYKKFSEKPDFTSFGFICGRPG